MNDLPSEFGQDKVGSVAAGAERPSSPVVDEAERGCMLEGIYGADPDDCSIDWSVKENDIAPARPEEKVVKEKCDSMIVVPLDMDPAAGYETVLAVITDTKFELDEAAVAVMPTPSLEAFAAIMLLGLDMNESSDVISGM